MEKGTKKCPYCGEEILAVAKKCKYCGEWLTEQEVEEATKQMIPCPICSEMIEEGAEICPHCNEKVANPDIPALNETKSTVSESKKDDARSFFNYYLWDPFFRHYFDFKGRLNRKHYWLSIVVWLVVLVALLILYPIGTMILAPLFIVVSIIPLYATAARRIRDGDSMPGIIGWSSLFFPYGLWWLVKPTEPRLEETEEVPADTPQPVKFKKADKIVCLVYGILFVIGMALIIIPSGSDDKDKEKETELSVEDSSEENTASNDSEETETPYGILSVNDALYLNDLIGLSTQAERYLVGNGYEYVGEAHDTKYWAKDCTLGRGENGYNIVDYSSESSYIELSNSGVSITAYDNSVFKAWYSQLKELGYQVDEESNQGNQGQDWNAEKDGASPITIWNDYGNCYSLIIIQDH